MTSLPIICMSTMPGLRADSSHPAEAVETKMYGVDSCGGWTHGHHAVEAKAHRDQFSWTALISRYTKIGHCGRALETYDEMRKSGVAPSSYTYVAALKACSRLLDLRRAKQIHAQVVESRLESDVYVGTVLVDTYAKCESLVDAMSVFEKMPHRNIVVWNVVIYGFAQAGRCDTALQLYARMQHDGVLPNERTFVGALKALSKTVKDIAYHEVNGKHVATHGTLKLVRALHSDIVKSGAESNMYVGNMLVTAYTKAGSLVDALHVFETLPHRNVVCWTTIILACVQMEQSEIALQLYARMHEQGVVPDERAFVAALKSCSGLVVAHDGKTGQVDVKSACLDRVRAIHWDVRMRKLECDLHVGTMLVDAYAKCGSLVDARQAFEKLLHRDVVSWNAMIYGYAQMEEGTEALQLYTRMQQEEGLFPNERTFVGALKACWYLLASAKGNGLHGKHAAEDDGDEKRCIEQVKAIHSDIVRSGCQLDEILGNMLVDLYAKFGRMVDAREVFEQVLPRADVVAWNSMILGYANMKEGGAALELYSNMQAQGVVPNERTFVAALKACCSSCNTSLAGLEDNNRGTTWSAWTTWNERFTYGGRTWWLEQVRRIQCAATESGHASSMYVGNLLIDVFAKCGSLVEARRVFDTMTHLDVVSWTAIIVAYAQVDDGEVALALYRQMRDDAGVSPDGPRLFVGALKACCSLAAREECGDMKPVPVNFGWYGQQCHGSLLLPEEVRKPPVRRCLDHVREIHADIMKQQFQADACVSTMLLDAYAKCGSLVDARQVFERMPYRDVVAWNAMISVYAQAEAGEAALALYAQMKQEGVVPDERTLVSALKACGTTLDHEPQGSSNHQRQSAGEKRRTTTDVTTIAARKPSILVSQSLLEEVRAIHADAVRTGHETDLFVANMLVEVYAKCCHLAEARHVFESISERDIVSWNVMLAGYTSYYDAQSTTRHFDRVEFEPCSGGEEALHLYRRMLQEGKVQPDARTFVAVLRACGSVAALETGRQMHAHISRTGLLLDRASTDSLYIHNALIDMYAKCGSMADAHQVFDAAPHHDVVTWSALMAGYARNGDTEIVLGLLARMWQAGARPNARTLLTVLTACSHAGLVDRGVHLLHAMAADLGVVPAAEHYLAVIDLLGRAGCLDAAVELARSVPDACAAAWKTVLAACQKWSDVDLARQAFACAVQADEADGAPYVLMANVYAAAEMWEEARQVRALGARCGPQGKKPASRSWVVDVCGCGVWAFSVGGMDSHPLQVHPSHLHAELFEICVKLRNCG